MSPIRTLSLSLALFSVALFGCGADEPSDGGTSYELSSTALVFDMPDSVQTLPFTVQNTGSSELSVDMPSRLTAGYEIVQIPGRFDSSSNGMPSPILSASVAPGASFTFEILRRPSGEMVEGALVIRLRQGSVRETFSLPLIADGPIGRLYVTPEALEFSDIPASDEAYSTATLVNIGDRPLTIEHFGVEGDDDFAIAEGEEFDEPFVLGPDETRDVTVKFVSSERAGVGADLVVRSRQGLAPTQTRLVRLGANPIP